MSEPTRIHRSELILPIYKRLQLINTLNRLPLSQLLDIEIALGIPSQRMPSLSVTQAQRSAALFRYLEGSDGPGLVPLLDVLEMVGIKPFTGVTHSLGMGEEKVSSILRVMLTSGFNESDREIIKQLLYEIRTLAQDFSVDISQVNRGGTELELQGSVEALQKIKTSVDLREVTDLLNRQVQNIGSIETVQPASDPDLQFADLREADLHGVDLRAAKLCSIKLRCANLTRADLCGADLSHAILSDADLRRANLRGADLHGAVLTRAILHKTDLCRANCSGAYLARSNLVESGLAETDLRKADLRGADLSRAYLFKASLIEANLNDTIFSEAIVEEATFGNNQGLTSQAKENLKKQGAIFPEDLGREVHPDR